MTPEADARRYEERYEEIYKGLPPLDSPEYLQLLETAKPEELPAEVLVRAYRQLCQAEPHGAAAGATIEAMLVRHGSYYFSKVRFLAWSEVAGRKPWVDAEDLVADVMAKVCELLPGDRGRHAEKNWVVFTINLYRDVRRSYHGRKGAKGRAEQGESAEDGISLQSDAQTAARYKEGARPRRGGFDQTARIETVIAETVAKIQEPFLKKVAEDQFGPNPSLISSKSEKEAPQTLSVKLGVTRHKVERALKVARTLVRAALLSDPTLDLDEEWIRRYIDRAAVGSNDRARAPFVDLPVRKSMSKDESHEV
jgi:DNA-directed RNA polymerase specialized sigma24 family protein